MLVFHWSVVGCNNTNEEVGFQGVPFSETDITFFSAHLYIIKTDCGTPHNITINPPYNQRVKRVPRKKLPMDYNNVESLV